jgi:hypothetical protein
VKLLNERAMIRGVAERFADQYDGADWSQWPDRKPAWERLRALDVETATAADVDAAIGTRGWASPPTCNECGDRGQPVVQLGQEPDYESSTAWICLDCLRRAVALAECAVAP